MNRGLPKINPSPKGGDEPFHNNRESQPVTLKDYWRWSASDLLSNTTRGVLAEFIVAKAMGVGKDEVRQEWDAYDLRSPSGIKVEIKSAAYIQSWQQDDYSKITFSIRPARTWDAETNEVSTEVSRPSDVYVFALLSHKDQATIDPLDLAQWEFYVVATKTLNEQMPEQKTLSLNAVKKLCPEPFKYDEVLKAIGEAEI